MTLNEKVNKFEFMDTVWILDDTKISKGYYVGYCGDLDAYSVLFDYFDDCDVQQCLLCYVFATEEDAQRELAIRNINHLQNQINAIKKEYNL